MDKQLYAKCLSERLLEMQNKNQEATKLYNKLQPIKLTLNTEKYWIWFNSLNKDEQIVVLNQGKPYKKSDFKRLRVELNKILIEIEKEN